ncbi:hypothetical protein [Streptomyces uncialis]|uniref:hypothetical protein n=1 Tax=Streptomyces uncialis TaxID=1048205 RepID=UPI0033FC5654
MDTRTAAATIAALLLSTLAGCGTDGPDKTTILPLRTTSPAPMPSPVHDFEDCQALLDRAYQADDVRDVSGEPECEALTAAEYREAVAAVLSEHKDEILAYEPTHTDKAVWDVAWEAVGPSQRKRICREIEATGAEAVGVDLADGSVGRGENEGIAQAEYYENEKC